MVDGPRDPELPSPPDWMAGDAIACKVWNWVLTNLVDRWLWDPFYQSLLAMLAKGYSLYRELHEAVAAAGEEGAQSDRDELDALRVEIRKLAAMFHQIPPERVHLFPVNSDGFDEELERRFG